MPAITKMKITTVLGNGYVVEKTLDIYQWWSDSSGYYCFCAKWNEKEKHVIATHWFPVANTIMERIYES